MRRIFLVCAALVFLAAPARAEEVTVGDTSCLLQPAAYQDEGLRRYVLFLGSDDFFRALYEGRYMTAADGELLIPQGDTRYRHPSGASDAVIKDLKPLLYDWTREGYEITLIGFSSGGYPATALAVYLARTGHSGRLVLMDGIYGNYRSVRYDADYFRSTLYQWDVTIYASCDIREIAGRTREVGRQLKDEDFVTYIEYEDKKHSDLKDQVQEVLYEVSSADATRNAHRASIQERQPYRVFTLELDANGGTVGGEESRTLSLIQEADYTLPAPDKREGFAFAGWYEAEADGEMPEPGDPRLLPAGEVIRVAGPAVFTAVWKKE